MTSNYIFVYRNATKIYLFCGCVNYIDLSFKNLMKLLILESLFPIRLILLLIMSFIVKQSLASLFYLLQYFAIYIVNKNSTCDFMAFLASGRKPSIIKSWKAFGYSSYFMLTPASRHFR